MARLSLITPELHNTTDGKNKKADAAGKDAEGTRRIIVLTRNQAPRKEINEKYIEVIQ